MYTLLLGLVIFFAVHSVSIVAPQWRHRTVLRMGVPLWRAFYSLLSLGGLLLIIRGFALSRAAPVVLYAPGVRLHLIVSALMLPVFPLLFSTYLPGRIRSAARHPTLVAIKLWAVAHLLANGTLADVLLFGSFLAWAVLDRISLKRRPARPVAGAPPGKWNDLLAIVLGLAVYALFVGWAHWRLFGVAPLVWQAD
ncbi:MAG: NnrU family protein [Steroidobacteraceae bacterium]